MSRAPARLCAAVLTVTAVLASRAAEIELQRLPTGDIGVLICLTGTLDGRPLRWLIDTGASQNLVALRVPAVPARPAETARVSSANGALEATRVTLGRMRVGDLVIDPQTVWQVDLSPVLGPLAAQVDGVLGMPFLEGRRIEIDLQRQRIDLDAAPLDGPDGVAIERARGLPVLTLDLQGRRQRLLLDTGAAGGIVRLRRSPGDVGVWRAPLVQVAGLPRRQVPVADLPGTALGRALPADVQGSLGMAVLDGCRFTLDLARERFVLRQCASESLPGGFGLQWAAVDGRLVLARVWPGSPASRAGLIAGDRVIGLGGAPAPADAAAADALLAGAPRIAVEIERGAERVAATLERDYFLPLLPER